jgi:hypothetical protein
LSVWNPAANPLNDLLCEPNSPKYSLSCECDGGCQIWRNRQRLVNQQRSEPDEAGQFKVQPLRLKLALNQVVIPVGQTTGEWKFSGKLDGANRSFSPPLEFAALRPDG